MKKGRSFSEETGAREFFQNELNQKPYRIGAIHCCALDFTNPGGRSDDPDNYDQQTEKKEEPCLPDNLDINK
jgi:hypothetical protein